MQRNQKYLEGAEFFRRPEGLFEQCGSVENGTLWVDFEGTVG